MPAITATFEQQPIFRNRIINGDMRIDQRNAGASLAITTTGQYTLDRWYANIVGTGRFSVQQSTTVPSYFVNSAIITGTTADASLASTDSYTFNQKIEGTNVADLGWGAAGAKSVVLSFWVRGSATGTYAGCVQNSAQDRSYVFTYAINAANTWEFKTITIAGDTSGTWLTTTGIGIHLRFDLGSGSNFQGTGSAWNAANNTRTSGSIDWISTNSRTLYFTGVQLEPTVVTPFEVIPFGESLRRCQRYWEKSFDYSVAPANNVASSRFLAFMSTTTNAVHLLQYAETKRVQATFAYYSPNEAGSSAGQWMYFSGGVFVAGSAPATLGGDRNGLLRSGTNITTAAGTAGDALFVAGHWVADAEL